jgi:tetratricopeptide (TPR) repeat protein
MMCDESIQKRLERNCHYCVNDQVAAAELDLYEWQRHDACPVAARVLLAALFAKRGLLDDALAVLPRPNKLHDDDDIAAAQLRVSLLVSCELNSAASRVLNMLHHDVGHLHHVQDWIQFMQMPGSSNLGESQANVDQLAEQLYEQPQVIASLVAAQRIEADTEQVDLLRQALSRLWRHVDGDQLRIIIIKAQAQLAIIADDQDDARRWAQRGLEINPYNAELAMVLAKVADDPAMSAPTVVVLDRVSSAHPTYSDVKRALIELEHTQGQTVQAQSRLAQWLRNEPDNPIAADLAGRIAA